jgi:nitrogen regulatory protein PII 2
MKEIIAIIRNECVEPSKSALESIGIKGITFSNVTGRGRQKGTIHIPDPEGTLRRRIGVHLLLQRGLIRDADNPRFHVPVEKELELGFLPKRMLMMVADDDDVPSIVQTLIRVNNSGHHGDGKIFICPVAGAIRIRTGEQGNPALS